MQVSAEKNEDGPGGGGIAEEGIALFAIVGEALTLFSFWSTS